MSISLLIVDDDPTVREGFATYFSYADDITVGAVVADGEQAWELLKDGGFDVVLSDIHMPNLDGPGLLARVRTLEAPPAFVAITALDTDEAMLRMIGAGAAGYVVKSAAPERLFAAVRDAANGGTTVSPEALTRLVDYVPSAPDPQVADTLKLVDSLAESERVVLDLLCRGMSNADIAAHAYYAESSVKKTVSQLVRRFGVSSRLELVVTVLDARGGRREAHRRSRLK